MKKIATLLSVVLLFTVCNFTVSAKNNIPVSAMISETDDGDISVVVFSRSPEKLVSFFTVIEYDTSLYTLKGAKASQTELSEGDFVENFPGMWVFGNLADGTGCVGAFVSYSGVTKKGEAAACEFIIHPETTRKNLDDLKVYVKEYITDDGDEENDIYKKTSLDFTKAEVDVNEMFDYSVGETVTITQIKNPNDIVFIPELIEGITVRSLEIEVPSQNAFIVFGRSVLSVKKGALPSENMVIAPVNSAPEAAVKISGGKYFSYRENVVADLNDPIFYTHESLVNNGSLLFETDSEYSVSPSHKIGGFWGTGTVISLRNGIKNTEFLLCVMGDINGDSLCDALDTMLCEKYVNGIETLSGIAEKSTDFTGDEVVDVQDYSHIVNNSLNGGNPIFGGVRGDFNGDYAIDVLDIFAFDKMRESTDLSTENAVRMDLNNDGRIDDTDVKTLELLIEFFE